MVVNRNPEYFFTIVRERSISRAAEKLYLSQSSLSQHVAKLEEGLDARLFDRTQSPIALTAAGELYRSYLESSTFLYQKFLADLTDLNAQRTQMVHLGMGSWRGGILAPQVLPPFLREHPTARVELLEFPVSELYAMLEEGKIDLAVMNTASSGAPEGFISEVIAYERILLVLHREDSVAREFAALRSRGGEIDLNRLEGSRLISLTSTLTVGRHVSNFLQKNRLSFPNRLSSTNNTSVLGLVEQGMGFCFLVETGLQETAHPDLVFFDLHTPDLSIPLALVHKSGSYLSPLTQSLMESIREYYRTFLKENDPERPCGRGQ